MVCVCARARVCVCVYYVRIHTCRVVEDEGKEHYVSKKHKNKKNKKNAESSRMKARSPM